MKGGRSQVVGRCRRTTSEVGLLVGLLSKFRIIGSAYASIYSHSIRNRIVRPRVTDKGTDTCTRMMLGWALMDISIRSSALFGIQFAGFRICNSNLMIYSFTGQCPSRPQPLLPSRTGYHRARVWVGYGRRDDLDMISESTPASTPYFG